MQLPDVRGEEVRRGWGGCAGCGGWISSSFSAGLDFKRQLASQVGMSGMQMMYESGAQGRSLVIQTREPSIENGAPSHKAGHHQRVQTEQSGEEHARGGGSPVLRRAGQMGGFTGEFTATQRAASCTACLK